MAWSVCFYTTLLWGYPVKKIKEKRLDYLPVFLLFLIPQMAIIKPIISGIANIAVNDIHDHKNGSIGLISFLMIEIL